MSYKHTDGRMDKQIDRQSQQLVGVIRNDIPFVEHLS
jgi:hypothetical protein